MYLHSELFCLVPPLVLFLPHPCPTHRPCPSPQMSQCKHLVQSKEKEVTRLIAEEKALETSFLEKVEENKFKDFLVRVFKKKIKRVKKEVKKGGEQLSLSEGTHLLWCSVTCSGVHVCVLACLCVMHSYLYTYVALCVCTPANNMYT